MITSSAVISGDLKLASGNLSSELIIVKSR